MVVVGVLGVLLGVLLPSLGRMRNVARQTKCLAGLRQIGVAVVAYSLHNDDSIPYGPKAPPPSATNFYPQTGNVTSLISLESGGPVGLGLLLRNELVGQERILFCPAPDNPWDAAASLAQVGHAQVEASYYYRHASVASLGGALPPPSVKIHDLGRNRKGAAVRCLAFDTQFLAPPKMQLFNLKTRTHHRRAAISALYTDSHAATFANDADQFTVNVSMSVYQTLDRILTIFEELDAE
jgi:type II secretory pathway pseudopilin PulG